MALLIKAQKMRGDGWTLEEIGKQIRMSPQWISYGLRNLDKLEKQLRNWKK